MDRSALPLAIVTFLLVGAVLLSMAVGWALPRLDRLRAWVGRMAEEGGRMAAARRAHRESLRLAHRMRRLEAIAGAEITSSGAPDPEWAALWSERLSDAAEGLRKGPEGGAGNPSGAAPSLVELIEAATDAELLRALALARGPDGAPRWAASRIGTFAGGRLEVRIQEIREIRGEAPPPADPDALVTPYAGRTTRRSLYRTAEGG